MNEPKPIGHNRDAFRLALIIALLFALFLIVLGIAAWNTRIAFMPLVPKSPAPAGKVFSLSAAGFSICPPVSNPPAGARKASGVSMFTLASDAAVSLGPRCRPAENFLRQRESPVSPRVDGCARLAENFPARV